MPSRLTRFVTAQLRRRAWEILRAKFGKSGEAWPYASSSKVESNPGVATVLLDYFRDLPFALPAMNATLPSQDDLKRWVKSLEKLLTENPGASLAAAFVLGGSVGWWMKRR